MQVKQRGELCGVLLSTPPPHPLLTPHRAKKSSLRIAKVSVKHFECGQSRKGLPAFVSVTQLKLYISVTYL